MLCDAESEGRLSQQILPMTPLPAHKDGGEGDGHAQPDEERWPLRQSEAFRGYQDIARNHERHEDRGQERYPEIAPLPHKPHRDAPKREACQRLVAPGKITPEHIEVDAHHDGAENEQWGIT